MWQKESDVLKWVKSQQHIQLESGKSGTHPFEQLVGWHVWSFVRPREKALVTFTRWSCYVELSFAHFVYQVQHLLLVKRGHGRCFGQWRQRRRGRRPTIAGKRVAEDWWAIIVILVLLKSRRLLSAVAFPTGVHVIHRRNIIVITTSSGAIVIEWFHFTVRVHWLNAKASSVNVATSGIDGNWSRVKTGRP